MCACVCEEEVLSIERGATYANERQSHCVTQFQASQQVMAMLSGELGLAHVLELLCTDARRCQNWDVDNVCTFCSSIVKVKVGIWM